MIAGKNGKNNYRVLMLSLLHFFLKQFLYMVNNLGLLNKSDHLSLLSVCTDGFSCI